MFVQSKLQQILTAAALVAGAPLIGSAIAPDAGIGQAQAQFTGRIKRVRIKKRRVGTGYKIRVVGESSPDDTALGGSVAVRDAQTGEPIGGGELGAPQRGKVRASGDDGAFEDLNQGESDTVTLTYRTGVVQDDGSVDGNEEIVTIPFELTTTDAGRIVGDGVGENGWKARLRTTGDGGVRAVVLHENKLWAGEGVDDLQLEGPEGAVGLSVDTITQTFTTGIIETSIEVLTDVDATLEYSLSGPVGRTDTVDLNATPMTPVLSKLTARETAGGDAKLVTITEGGDASLAVEMIDNATGEPVISTIDETPVSTVRIYEHRGLEFDPGEDAGNYIYLMLIDMLDANGDPVGSQYEIELTVPALVEGETTITTAPFGDGLGQVIMTRDAEGFGFSVGIKNTAAVDAVNLIFEEPFEGPTPFETEVNATPAGQLNKWVQKGQTALPESFTLTTELTNAAGEVVSGASVTGGPGVVYKNGSGTKKAANQAQNQHLKLL